MLGAVQNPSKSSRCERPDNRFVIISFSVTEKPFPLQAARTFKQFRGGLLISILETHPEEGRRLRTRDALPQLKCLVRRRVVR